MPGKVADFLRATELEPTERAALDQGVTVRRGQGHIGNGKERANPDWRNLQPDFLKCLATAGCSPDSVDLVILTHLHADHVGWNTREANGEWAPASPTPVTSPLASSGSSGPRTAWRSRASR